MPRISILGLTDADAVKKAIAEHDELGAEAFRERYGFGEADDYFLIHDGRTYDSKAIAGVAYGIQHGVRVTPRDFSGGKQTVVKALERLEFEVTRPDSRTAKTHPSPHRSSVEWDASEMLLALHWYLQYRSEPLGADHPAVVALSGVLQQRAVARGRPEIARARGPAEVATQIVGFVGLDPKGVDGPAPSRAHADTWSRWAGDTYARRKKLEQILDELHEAESPDRRSATRRELADAWDVVDTPAGYQPRTTKRAESDEPSAPPVDLLSFYRGPRTIASRTAAEPRVEDPEAFDRANAAHEEVRGALATFLMAHGFCVYDSSSTAKQRNVDFDLAADDGELRLVIEAKSMPTDAKAEAGRLRLGLGQVLWYRHRFLAVCRDPRVAVLVVARPPKDHEDWLAACREAHVVLTWPERFEWLVDECRCARALW